MLARFNQLLSRYENGHITRRELLGAVAALVAAAPAAPAAGLEKSDAEAVLKS